MHTPPLLQIPKPKIRGRAASFKVYPALTSDTFTLALLGPLSTDFATSAHNRPPFMPLQRKCDKAAKRAGLTKGQ